MFILQAYFFQRAARKLPSKYRRSNCQKIIDKKVVLKKITIISRFKPCGETNKAAIRPTINKIAKPITGEKITGKRIGLLTTPFIDLKGVKVKPIKVFVHIYATNTKNVCFFIKN